MRAGLNKSLEVNRLFLDQRQDLPQVQSYSLKRQTNEKIIPSTRRDEDHGGHGKKEDDHDDDHSDDDEEEETIPQPGSASRTLS
jgi:hypothetical protein